VEFDLRIKALAKLARSTSPKADAAIEREIGRAIEMLRNDREYERLEHALETLDTIGYRRSKLLADALTEFTGSVEQRQLSYSDSPGLLKSHFSEYINAYALIARAIEVLSRLRYLETTSVLRSLLSLSLHSQDKVRNKALEALENMAEYDLDVFYDAATRRGVGAYPQKQIIDLVEGLSPPEQKAHLEGLLKLSEGLLSTSMRGSEWTYNSVTFSSAVIPPIGGIAEIRGRCITTLKKLYSLGLNDKDKLRVLAVLNDATRWTMGTRGIDALVRLKERDTLEVLAFYKQLVETEKLFIVQKIEHDTYWIFFHSQTDPVRTAAFEVRDAIDANAEYQIYKVLVGFEGIFGDWNALRQGDRDWEVAEARRKERAVEFARAINDQNFDTWRARILKYASIESNDLATFPVFYFFLEEFARLQPALALNLVRSHSEEMSGFLIPLLRTLLDGAQKDATESLIRTWLIQARFLQQAMRVFLGNPNTDSNLARALLQRAVEVRDTNTVSSAISVAVSSYSEGKKHLVEELFVPALTYLTERQDTRWIFDFWFRKEAKVFLRDLGEAEIDLVLANLRTLKEIDYHAEEVLYLIARRMPAKVLQYFCDRIELANASKELIIESFEAVPFSLHKLNEPLAKIPTEAVRMIRSLYKGDLYGFMFRGARLLQSVFPDFPQEFEAELMRLVREGGEENWSFVLSVLRNYEGELFIHQTCKELIKSLPSDSPLRMEVAIALESTGVVSGEFGMAEAYERKKNEVLGWLDDADSKVREFANEYIASLEKMSLSERKRAEEELALRKHKYGE
jgi:hypothetical protein